MNKVFGHVGMLCFSFCLVCICFLFIPSFSVQAAGRTYEFELRNHNYQKGDYNEDAWTNFVIVGNDVDFYSVYWFSDSSDGISNRYSYIYALSSEPFTYSYNRNTRQNNGSEWHSSVTDGKSSSTIVDGQTVYWTSYSLVVPTDLYSLENLSGWPNLYYMGVQHSGEDFLNGIIKDFFNEQLKEFVSNGGLDWEADVSKFIDFSLTGVTYENLGSGLYNVYWTGTTLNDDIYGSSSGRPHNEEWTNGKVDAFAILEDEFGREYTAELGSASLKSGKITIPIVGPDFDRSSFDGKIYLLPHIDYFGKTYNGSYTILNIKTGLIYNVSSSEGSQTYTWDDFFLSNVKLTKDLIGYYKISWQGTTRSADLLFIPDSDTLVVAAIALEDSQGNIINQEVASTTIGKGYFYFDFEKLLDQDRETAYYWDGLIYLMPTFTKEGNLYMGQYSVVDTLSGDIFQDVLDEDNDIVHREPVGSGGSSVDSFGVSSMTDYINTGFSFLSDLINMMQGFPALFAAIFQFIPQIYINAIGVMLIIIFIARILGR